MTRVFHEDETKVMCASTACITTAEYANDESDDLSSSHVRGEITRSRGCGARTRPSQSTCRRGPDLSDTNDGRDDHNHYNHQFPALVAESSQAPTRHGSEAISVGSVSNSHLD